jgi:Domain of unknown function (DUF5004)
MKSKFPLLFILGLILINLLSNSCKKDTSGSITSLFTNGSWQLASVTVTTTINMTQKDTILNTTCDSTQILIFKSDNSCTYTNFDCIPQKVSGHWSLSADNLTLSSDMLLKDTTAAGTSTPFKNAQFFNAGDYSLVLQTGDYNIIPTTINKTKVIRYGFIRQKTSIKK